MIDETLLVRFVSLNNHAVRVVTGIAARVSLYYLRVNTASTTCATNQVGFAQSLLEFRKFKKARL